jgi:hypothetical protein
MVIECDRASGLSEGAGKRRTFHDIALSPGYFVALVRAVIVVMSAISSAREIILFLSVSLLPFIAEKN